MTTHTHTHTYSKSYSSSISNILNLHGMMEELWEIFTRLVQSSIYLRHQAEVVWSSPGGGGGKGKTAIGRDPCIFAKGKLAINIKID